MSKQTICKGDKVIIIRGEGATHLDPETQKPVVCTVLKVDRGENQALLDMPRPKTRGAEKQKPIRGVEQWKTARYNPKTGEAGGLKVVKRPVHLSNLQLVEKRPAREFKVKES
jgi:ribosomal protein L24